MVGLFPAMTTEEKLLQLVLDHMTKLEAKHDDLAREMREEFKALRQELASHQARSSEMHAREREEIASLKTRFAVWGAVAVAVMTGVAQWAVSFFR